MGIEERVKMQIHVRRERPESWEEFRRKVRRGWAVPFAWMEYQLEWVVYLLSNWRFLEVLEYLGSLGVLVAVVFYFSESGDRLKQKHYQAWQVINSAQGKGGNGGRIEALEELNADRVPLVGVDVSGAFLQGVRLKKSNLVRANFDGADARGADLEGARAEDGSFRSANFRGGKLAGASLRGSVMDGADLAGIDLRGADLGGVSLEDADLRGADLKGTKWKELKSVKGANVWGVKAPEGFQEWALAHGAVRKQEE
jgi:hypothetical protein